MNIAMQQLSIGSSAATGTDFGITSGLKKTRWRQETNVWIVESYSDYA